MAFLSLAIHQFTELYGHNPMTKILTADDLARVDTLGFRGEALHAIGAVSSLTLTTCERGAGRGFRVAVFTGDLIGTSPAAHLTGTTVEVRNLFLNLPVRRGFLGTERAEVHATYDNGTPALPH